MRCGVVLCIQKRGAVRDIDMADLTLLDSPAVRDCQSHASHFNYSLLVTLQLFIACVYGIAFLWQSCAELAW